MRKKKARGALFAEGQRVTSTLPQDGGAEATVVALRRSFGEWCCVLQEQGTDRIFTRRERDLRPFS